MIITDFDNVITAEDARRISLNNRDDSVDRTTFRELMSEIREHASYGYTRYSSTPKARQSVPSDMVIGMVEKLGYKVVLKRCMKWDEETKSFSTEKPVLDALGRDQYFIVVMWG